MKRLTSLLGNSGCWILISDFFVGAFLVPDYYSGYVFSRRILVENVPDYYSG